MGFLDCRMTRRFSVLFFLMGCFGMFCQADPWPDEASLVGLYPSGKISVSDFRARFPDSAVEDATDAFLYEYESAPAQYQDLRLARFYPEIVQLSHWQCVAVSVANAEGAERLLSRKDEWPDRGPFLLHGWGK